MLKQAEVEGVDWASNETGPSKVRSFSDPRFERGQTGRGPRIRASRAGYPSEAPGTMVRARRDDIPLTPLGAGT